MDGCRFLTQIVFRLCIRDKFRRCQGREPTDAFTIDINFRCRKESPIFSGQGPATSPLEIPMVEGWQLIESPDFMFEETAEMVMQPPAECSPEFMHEESPEFDLQPSASCPPEQGYVPQAYHQLYKVNGILHNSVFLRCRHPCGMWMWL